ncbi:MAG: hypothetical protein JWN67_429 [Actinomycetia bacterium]|nr:hypothetical protein [Actinomycetes bacterium]
MSEPTFDEMLDRWGRRGPVPAEWEGRAFTDDEFVAIDTMRFLWQAQVAEEMLDMGQLSSALLRVGRAAAPRALVHWREKGRVSDDELREVLVDVWTMNEWPLEALDLEVWLELFVTTGFVSDRPGEERPTVPVALYRGAAQEHRAGMAWTTSRQTAEWFAERRTKLYGEPSIVWTVEAQPFAVLATAYGRHEQEVIVYPALVADQIRPG